MSDWEDIAFGAPVSASGGEWEDVAFGVSPSLTDTFIQGIKSAPASTLAAVKDIPTGLSNLINSIFNPIDSINDGTTETTLRGVGTLASGTAGAASGAAAGAGLGALGGPLAPVTVPVGAILGGAVGGASGLLGYDWLNQMLGSDEATTPEQDAQKLAQLSGEGVSMGALAKGAQGVVSGISKIKSALPEAGKQMNRRSIGTRQSDYGSTADLSTILTPDGVPETYVKAALDDLLTNNKLGKSRNPGDLMKAVDDSSQRLSTQIDTAIKNFDEGGAPAPKPAFENALEYLYEGKVPANEIPAYVRRLDALDQGITSEGGGKLSYLQQQKIALGKNYSTTDAVKAGFERQMYKDLQKTIESVTPEVGPLNAELGKYLTAKPIISRLLKQSETMSGLDKLAGWTYTTGGITAPAILGSFSGPVGTAVGLGAGVAAKALRSPTGQAKTASLIKTIFGDKASGPSALETLIASPEGSALMVGGALAGSPENLSGEPLSQNSTTTLQRTQNTQPQLSSQGSQGLPDQSVSSSSNDNPESSLVNQLFGEAQDMSRTPEFDQKADQVAKNLNVPTKDLLKVIGFETGGTFSSSVKNQAGSGATGLIQFMGATAKELLGTKTEKEALDKVASMNEVEQLDLVEKYLRPYKHKINSLDDLYMAVLYPKAIDKDASYPLFKEGTTAYRQNKGLDADKDGVITKAEAASKVRNYQV